MNTKPRRVSTALLLALSTLLSFSTFQAASEDIDIFSVDFDSTVDKPNVLIILDNSANWARQSQQWPGGLQQGQSEVRAITRVLNALPDNSVNVGLLEYITGGSANDADSGFIRYHMRPMNGTNKSALSNILYGPSAAGLPVSSSIFSNINDPQEKRSQGNPFGNLFWDAYNYLAGTNHSNAGAGTIASKADSAGYTSLYSVFRSPLTSADSCRRTVIIFIGNNVSNGPTADSQANVNALAGLGGNTSQIPFADYVVTSTPATAVKGTSLACYSNASACTTAENNATCTAAGFTSCFCDASTAQPCLQSRYTVYGRSTTQTVVSGPTTTTTSNVSLGEPPLTCKNANQVPTGSSCPQPSTVFSPGPGADETTETTTTWANCVYTDIGNSGCTGQKRNYERRGTKTVTTTVRRTTTVDTELGPSASCSLEASSCSTSGYAGCPPSGNTYQSCFCSAPSNTSGCPLSSTSRYTVMGNFTSTTATQTGTFSPAPAGPFMMDEWARFLRNNGVPLPGTSPAIRTLVTTYTIDVFNAQQNAEFSALLFNTARVGGGKYFQARNEDAIVSALTQIFNEVQAVNSAFASASLPVNATNRTQNENQVFIGLFRPDKEKNPLWFGNLKRYQIIASGASLELGDANGAIATNLQTGFIGDCAVSFWTTDSGDYWNLVGTDNPPAVSQCPGATNPHSDYPDGPFVEKGAVADRLRKRASARNMLTLSGGSLVAFNASSAPSLSAETRDFILGKDTNDDDNDLNETEARSTIHGDVIHSRPQPVNFGGTAAEIASGTKPGVVVFYGANDGTYRAVRAHTGEELWSFVAPEHFSKFERLRANDPKIKFFGDSAPNVPKDYFFDGSTGVFQNADNSNVRVFAGMRRGGRRIYSFNVTNPASPTAPWTRGCDAGGCDSGFEEIGQTWPFPVAAFVAGHASGTQPVVVLGGGYDTCEDADTPTPACTGARGSGVYVLDGFTGNLLKHFDFNGRSVAADVALIDVNGDQKVDHGYAVDTGGKVYRISFVDANNNPLSPGSWTYRQIAQTRQTSPLPGRKFLFPPAIVQLSSSVIYLAIGSGDREHPLLTQYPVTTPVTNRFYVFKDDLSASDTAPIIELDDTTGTVMRDLTVEDADCATDSSQCPAPLLPSSPEKGWFINLTENGVGEQVVSGALIVGGFVFFNTNRATPTSSTACTNSLGEARGYLVNLFNASGAIGVEGSQGGSRSSEFVGGGLPPTPVFAIVPVATAGGGTDFRPVLLGAVPKDGSTACTTCPEEPPLLIQSKRTPLYWYKTGDTD
ncbi:MAG TPA: PilC/PilY family type IV pilus protein [Nevskiales bacterium]|nr:PilC/PilY family type IV pilus protein [Nevskiales bacterium]